MNQRESRDQKPPVGQTGRKPVGMRQRDKTPTRKGYRRRWVNDIEDRVQMFQEGGYSPVKDEKGNVRRKRVGGGTQAVLMEIDEELYEQDQQAKYAEWNKTNADRLKSRAETPGFYTPKSSGGR